MEERSPPAPTQRHTDGGFGLRKLDMPFANADGTVYSRATAACRGTAVRKRGWGVTWGDVFSKVRAILTSFYELNNISHSSIASGRTSGKRRRKQSGKGRSWRAGRRA